MSSNQNQDDDNQTPVPSSSSNKSSGLSTGSIIGIVVGVLVAGALVVFLYSLYREGKRKKCQEIFGQFGAIGLNPNLGELEGTSLKKLYDDCRLHNNYSFGKNKLININI